MPVSDYNDWLAKTHAPWQRIYFSKSDATNAAANAVFGASFWGIGPNAPGNPPTTPATCDRTTTGAIPFQNSSSEQRVAAISIQTSSTQTMTLCDRLAHVSMSGSTTGTINLTWPALPSRQTTGVGVFAAVEIYGALSSSLANTIQLSYTNATGTAGRLTPGAFTLGVGGVRAQNQFRLLSLQGGDRGIQSVEQVIVTGANALAGTYGITLFRPLCQVGSQNPGRTDTWNGLLGSGGNIPVVPTDACLFLCSWGAGAAGGVTFAEFRLIET